MDWGNGRWGICLNVVAPWDYDKVVEGNQLRYEISF